ncbi:uncharacterized protein TRIADDRAFT_52022 [Trichoplax adhaerens]|uniref:PDZ domain-containing protein n=1 Tax=Trichoplax adhaerens TaxID=10228 RepID=B3RLJ3_TRIAD|nr:predicted protein [Trichoplax adhaerens]EDV28784.1 predicted protein [Trichoplax adhaerens]|eukprot:XP_002107986.1 predicted protein [Trichoplax adhaerens]
MLAEVLSLMKHRLFKNVMDIQEDYARSLSTSAERRKAAKVDLSNERRSLRDSFKHRFGIKDDKKKSQSSAQATTSSAQVPNKLPKQEVHSESVDPINHQPQGNSEMDRGQIPKSKISPRTSVVDYADLHQYEDIDTSAEIVYGNGIVNQQRSPITTPVRENPGSIINTARLLQNQSVNSTNSARTTPQRSPIHGDVPGVTPPSTFQDPKPKTSINEQGNRRPNQEQRPKQPKQYDVSADKQQRPQNLPVAKNGEARNINNLSDTNGVAPKTVADQPRSPKRTTPTENQRQQPSYQQAPPQGVQRGAPSNIRPSNNKYGYDTPQARPAQNPVPPQGYRRINSNDKSPTSDVIGRKPQQQGVRFPNQNNMTTNERQFQNYQARPKVQQPNVRPQNPAQMSRVSPTGNNPPNYNHRPSQEIKSQANNKPVRYALPPQQQQQNIQPRSAGPSVNTRPQTQGGYRPPSAAVNNSNPPRYIRPNQSSGLQNPRQRIPATQQIQYQVNAQKVENVYEISTTNVNERMALKNVTTSKSSVEQLHTRTQPSANRKPRGGIVEGEDRVIEMIKPSKGFGLSLLGASEFGVYVAKLNVGGAAEIDGRFKKGDQIIEVNGFEIDGMSYGEAAQILREIGVGSRATFHVRHNSTGLAKFEEFRERKRMGKIANNTD